ncbi:hypothetical protein HMPREF1487_05976 [Pseudomonas sp. HPB0071]|uniref:Sugar phosphate isomerase/epimerase n=1 Tax=Pseudomonas luteola TaxID=47886 RepID=A0ABS0FLF0_PSELU|nr:MULTISPECIES: sugar phosphate isomerase/epimerase family protein [Pseudomonas]ENA34322.1 hypothetical protein HMPREF1487_05976 [Pseudomonas sp. HPB0071]MBF8641180.1 sugar phosphate isomerase/epimerase [Pseudomonas zeshuii]RRW49082.1 sugar phosphate isomerase/epimerase [Pseudomonas luteola]SHI83672.1 Sugar phosphate isomerase/epimerase [Pseudomonas zeshuii]
MTTPRFAISQLTTTPWPLTRDLELFAHLNADIELAEMKFDKDAGKLAEQFAQLNAHGLRPVSLQPEVRTIYPATSALEPADPAERTALIKATIDRFAPFCTGIPVITNTGALGQSGNEAEVWEGCIKHYRELADHAADQGLSIAIEPLSPPMMSRDSILYTFMQGYELVQAVARENVGLCLDLYNSWQDADLSNAIRLAGDRIFLTQLSDWQRPRSYFDRRSLGDGIIPVNRLLAAVNETGYDGPYVLEIFSSDVPGALWEDDDALEQAILRSKARFEEAWATGDALANLGI